MGAPVFAPAGYAAASHVIPRGFALPQSVLARAMIYRRVMLGNSPPPIPSSLIRRKGGTGAGGDDEKNCKPLQTGEVFL